MHFQLINKFEVTYNEQLFNNLKGQLHGLTFGLLTYENKFMVLLCYVLFLFHKFWVSFEFWSNFSIFLFAFSCASVTFGAVSCSISYSCVMLVTAMDIFLICRSVLKLPYGLLQYSICLYFSISYFICNTSLGLMWS